MESTCSTSSLSVNVNVESFFHDNNSTETNHHGDGVFNSSTATEVVESTAINGWESLLFEYKAALRLQRVYRGYRTRRRLADTAVVAEELWWQAIDYVRLKQSTISFFDFAKPETAVSRWNRVSLNASKVGKGLSKDAKALKLAFQHWIEAIDPRHRYGHSLHLYYDEWRKADSGQPFFYWLDIGDGKEIELEECPRSTLRQQCIKYLGPLEREHYEYTVVDGKIVHKRTEEFLDTSEGEKGKKWIYVMSTSKKLYIGKKKKGKFHHSSFLAGGATLAAGRLDCENGVLKTISAYSGHYRPTGENLHSFLAILEENGINLDKVLVQHSEDYENYDDIVSIQSDNSKGVLKGTKPSTLNITKEILEDRLSNLYEVVETESSSADKRTVTGGLQSPRADVAVDEILQRMSTKKATSSYQLGHQLSLKWSTGAGPRIGCVADYPMELRQQALEYVNLSPRTPSSPLSFRQFSSFAPSAPHSTSDALMVV